MLKNLSTALLGLFILASCAKKNDSAPDDSYTVSIEPQRQVLEQLVAPGTPVVTLLRSGSSPETFEPSMAQRAAVDNAVAYFTTGVLPFESSLKESAKTRVADTSEGIEFIYGTHSHANENGHTGSHSDETPDPHYWTSVSSIRTIASNMLKTLIGIHPDSTEIYTARFNRLEQRLDSTENKLRSILAGHNGTTFAIWHPSLSYFARDYGLHQLAVGQESKEMSARQVREIIDEARADSVRVFFFQKEYDPRQSETINAAIGSRIVTIDPLAYDWEQQMLLIANEIARP